MQGSARDLYILVDSDFRTFLCQTTTWNEYILNSITDNVDQYSDFSCLF